MALKRAIASLLFGIFLALTPAMVEAQLPPPPAPSEWEAFTRRFMAADGRIVDTANRGISHSEGQGYAMVFAVHFNDRARFDQLWRWTRRNLARPRDSLAAWRFDPSSSLRVSDMNNATDGDIFIAWGLLLAAERWNEPEYSAAATRIAADILRCCVVQFRQRVVMLPGAQGFQDAEGVVVNLSYYAFPALRALSRAVPDPRWAQLENDGIALISDGSFGRWNLPPDWLLLPADGSPPRPAARWPARFSWDAVRVPLNLAWQQQDIAMLTPAVRFWSDPSQPRRPPAWVDLRSGEMPPYAGHAGVRAVHALALARTGGSTGAPLRVADAPDYFGSALVLQSRIAPYMRPEALGLAPQDAAPDPASRRAWLADAARSVWTRVSSAEAVEAEASSQSQWARQDFVEPAPVRGVVIGLRNTVPPRVMPAPRRALLAGGLGLATAMRGPPAVAQPGLPSLTVLVATDGIPGGEQTLRAFAQSHGHLLREALFLQEDTSWIGSGLTDEVRAGQAPADVVVANTAGFQAGSANQIWQALPPDILALADAVATPAGLLLRPIAGQTGLLLAAAPGGPVLLHNPATLPAPPPTAAALLDYARQNPGRLQYARPRESLYGQTFVTALPYLLGDRDPSDPQTGWNLTWDYLAELGRHVGYYPSSGTAALAEFADGGCDLAPCLLPNFLLARSLGLLPEGTGCAPFAPGILIADGMIMAVPRGLPDTRLPLVTALARFLLTPRIQARTFGRGLLPGFPQAEPVAADLLTAAESALWTQALSEGLRGAMAHPLLAPPLGPYQLGYMLRRWEDAIGAHHGRVP